MRAVQFAALLVTSVVYGSSVPGAHAGVIRVPYDYPTIREACQAAQAGDSVAVYPGDYHNDHGAVPPGVAVIGMGANPEQVRLVPSALAFYVHSGEGPVLIENLTAYEGTSGVLWNQNPQLLVRRCHLIETDTENIITTWADFVFQECWIEFDCWWGYCQMITAHEPVDILIEDCVVVGFQWERWSPPAGSSLEFRNNTVIGAMLASVHEGASTDFSLFFVNNIMTWGAGCGSRQADTIEWRYNDFAEPGYWPDCGYQIGNFCADPLFCDADGGDYRLQPDSPCIGTGEGGEDVGARLGVCWPQGLEEYLPQQVGRLQVSGPWPNPTTGGVSFAIAGAPVGTMRAEVFDATGTLIQRLPASGHGASTVFYRWNGRMSDGRLVPTGVYYVRLNGAAEKISKRVIIIR